MTNKKEMGRTAMPKPKPKTRLDLSHTGKLRAKQTIKRGVAKKTAQAKVAKQNAKRAGNKALKKGKALVKRYTRKK